MDGEEQLQEAAVRLAAAAVTVVRFMDHAARQGIGVSAETADHVRQLADIAAGDDFPLVKKLILEMATEIQKRSPNKDPLAP